MTEVFSYDMMFKVGNHKTLLAFSMVNYPTYEHAWHEATYAMERYINGPMKGSISTDYELLVSEKYV